MLVDEIIIKILINEQLDSDEKQGLINAYNKVGPESFKSVRRKLMKKYHPDRIKRSIESGKEPAIPLEKSEIGFREIVSLLEILEKLESNISLSMGEIETFYNLLGPDISTQIRAFAPYIPNMQQQDQQQQRSPVNTKKYNDINIMSDFVETYKQDLINDNRTGPGSNMESFERIMREFDKYKEQNFPSSGNIWSRNQTQYISSLGGEGETREAFIRAYDNAKNEDKNREYAEELGLKALEMKGFTQFLERYIYAVEVAAFYLPEIRSSSAMNAAKEMLVKIQQIEAIANEGDMPTAKSYYEVFKKEFQETGIDPSSDILSHERLSNLDTGLNLRDHAVTLFNTYDYQPDDFAL